MSKKRGLKALVKSTLTLTVALCAMLTSCSDDDSSSVSVENNSTTSYKTPKYVFYFIGDGMSATQINITEAAINDPDFLANGGKSVGLGKLNLRDLPVTGLQTTHAEDRYITGSAAAATALATGYKTTIGTISQNGDHSADHQTMAEMAKAKGMKVGIISSVSIDHATPACFYAHTDSRNNYYTIGQHLTQSNFDYFAGGGVRWNKYDNEGHEEDINLFLDAASDAGYSYVNTRAGFEALNSESGKVIATLGKFYTDTSDGAALPYVMDNDAQVSVDDKITLSEFTEKGIEVLDNDNGFFMMVEAGKVDWACHANDAVASIHNMVEFDKALGHALDFYNQHPEETLIVVTGDHETGGLALGWSSTGYGTAFELLKHQECSYVEFEKKVGAWEEAGNVTFDQALMELKNDFGLGDESKDAALALSDYEKSLLEDAFGRSMTGQSTHLPEELSVIYGYYDPFTVTATHILNNKAGVDFTTYSHTGVPVPVFAIGQGMYEFNGYYDNTDVADKIIDIANYKD